MTEGMWKCKKCGYEMRLWLIDTFIEKCSKCNAEYERLGTLHGAFHSIPIYRLKGDEYSEYSMNIKLAFTTRGIPTITCYSKEFYDVLIKEREENNGNVKIVLGD